MKSIFVALFAALSVAVLAIAPARAETSPESVPGAVTVTVEQAAQLFDQGVAFIDVRKASDFEAGRIPGAVNLDLHGGFSEQSLSAVVAKDQKLVIYCNGTSCLRSSEASAMAVGWGFAGVHYLRDGYPAWEAAGLPIE